ncbi:sensor histidine kinase [Maricaulis maris]|uniref:histidine kinase n=1 Tax=Maricaulis maris TaxID=74318 RepID=A0A495DL99_9PROT|nr:HAMP domain-containing sensor histidine kinase [Maricaulis maris]RKR03712.1 signal transduction histidine kinase [Maricaulis maris]
MGLIEYPKIDGLTGAFADDDLEAAYRRSVRAQALQLAAFIVVSSGLIWLVSISHEMGRIAEHPGMSLLIALRILLVVSSVVAAAYWLWRVPRRPHATEGHVLTAWLALYLVEIAVVSTVYLSLETTPQGLADRFLATSFWVTLTFGLVGIVTFHNALRARLFGAVCVVWYFLLLAVFRPDDPRPYLIGGTSMLVTLLILHFSLHLLGGAGRRNFHLTRVYADAREKAEEVNSVLSLLLTTTGHDARQPLFALDANALALDGAIGRADLPAARDLAARQRDLTRHVSHILTSVLELSRAERNLPGWRTRDEVALAALLDGIRDRVAAMIPSGDIALTTRVSPCTASTSAAMIERILVNLLVNAINHAGATRVQLIARPRRGRVVILVIDNGRGLSDVALDLDSAGFFANRLTPAAHNSGHGLDLVFRMAQLVDAPLRIRSRPGRGVIARLVLPIAAG